MKAKKKHHDEKVRDGENGNDDNIADCGKDVCNRTEEPSAVRDFQPIDSEKATDKAKEISFCDPEGFAERGRRVGGEFASEKIAVDARRQADRPMKQRFLDKGDKDLVPCADAEREEGYEGYEDVFQRIASTLAERQEVLQPDPQNPKEQEPASQSYRRHIERVGNRLGNAVNFLLDIGNVETNSAGRNIFVRQGTA